MSRVRTRLAALERRAPKVASPVITIWTQASDGSDAFTCDTRPDEVLTRAQIDELPPSPAGEISVIVVRVRPDET